MASVKFLLSLFGLALMASVADSKKLMVILLDGFRWDYFDIHGVGLRGFPKMFHEGVKAHHVLVDYPSKSWPNYYTIMTGLYDESHGMVGNSMYEPQRDEYFLSARNPGYNQSFWWDGGDPLWITATRQGRSANVYYWPNCQVTIRGLNPKFCAPYEGIPTMDEFSNSISDSLNAFENDEADLSVIYFELSDYTGHRYGPLSKEMREVVRFVDNEIYLLLGELTKRHLAEEVDLIVVSDHGMAEAGPDRVIRIDEYLDVTDIERFLEGYAMLCVWPKEGQLDKVYNQLKNSAEHFSVYKREETPEHWHYRKSDRICPIIVDGEIGWTILKPNQPYLYYNGTDPLVGSHGYDNILPDMWGIFVASGPIISRRDNMAPHSLVEFLFIFEATGTRLTPTTHTPFKSSHSSGYLEVVDLYQVMCSILGIQPSPHNGTWSRVNNMIYTSTGTNHIVSFCLVFCFSIALVVIRIK